ncbi:hypothetical protein B0H14DRAFT_3590365 [Mycena olivaceomarginata]|nr:hypothetical protein B0H14DRAFT_3590365 [Mycena olivaceomarginata]
MVTTWQLDVPGVSLHVPPVRDGYHPEAQPPAFNSLKFHPLGLFDLRRHLGALPRHPGIFERYRSRFLTSDIAWFAAGASTDGRHFPQQPGFFPEFDDLRLSLPAGEAGGTARKAFGERIRTLIFDLATLWDRVFGGTTMILHIEGTTVPNTPSLPEYLRCSAYLPPSFIANNPGRHPDIARIVQLFIESVGVPTVQAWRDNAHLRGWPLNQAGPSPHQNTPGTILIPNPRPNSAHYTFLGRPVGALEAILTTPAPPNITPVYIIPDDNDDPVDDTVWDLMEQARLAEALAQERLEQVELLQDHISRLQVQLKHERAQSAVASASAIRPPATPTRSRRTGATPVNSAPARSPAPRSALAPSPGRQPPPYTLPPPSGPSYLEAGSNLTAVIASLELDDLAPSIRMVMRGFEVWKWHQELETLGLTGDVLSTLLAAMARANTS